MSIARTTYLMPAFEVLGPLQISLGRMLGDITRFLVLFTLVRTCTCAYTLWVRFVCVFYDYCSHAFTYMKRCRLQFFGSHIVPINANFHFSSTGFIFQKSQDVFVCKINLTKCFRSD